MPIKEYDESQDLPETLNFYGASDFATMAPRAGKRDPDFTEHGVAGMDSRGDLWFVDWWSGQVETDRGIAAWIALLRKRPLIRWWDEGGLIDKAIGPTKRRAMVEAQKFVSLESLPMLTDKAVKLQAFHARVTASTVHFPLKKKWAEDVIDQLVKFPAGRWDDKADVCGLIGRGVDMMTSARVEVAQRPPDLVPYTAAWLEHDTIPTKPKVRYF